MKRTMILKAVLACAASASSLMIASASWGQEGAHTFNIPAQPLGEALTQLSEQADVTIFAPAELVEGLSAPALVGGRTTQEALDALLEGTGLFATEQANGAILIQRVNVQAINRVPASERESLDLGNVESIVVRGERAINMADIAQKRSQDAIYDSINVDEIGSLPDFNLPDSFRRVPGVSAVFDEDEGQFITARGMPLSYNFTTFDGLGVATVGGFGDGSRNVNLQAIPRTAIKRLEVFKTHTPDKDLGWIGGYFNLVTRSAFDADGLYFTARGQLNYFTADEVPNYPDVGSPESSTVGGRFEATLSNTFGRDEQFGFVLSGTYYSKTRDQMKYQTNSYQYFGPDADNDGLGDWAAPQQYRWYSYTNQIERYGGSLRIDWRPTASSELSWNTFLYSMFESESRGYHSIHNIKFNDGDITPDDQYSGRFTGGQGRIGISFFPNDRQMFGSNLSGSHTFDNEGELSASFGVTTAQHADDFFEEASLASSTENLSGRYDMSNFNPVMSLDPESRDLFYSEENFGWLFQHDNRTRMSHERVWNFRADYDFRTQGFQGFGYKIGVDYRDIDRKRDLGRITYAEGRDTGLQPGWSWLSDYRPLGRPDYPMMYILYDQFRDRANLTINEDETHNRDLQDDFNYLETVTAGYAMATYTAPKWKIIGGLRYETTDVGGYYYSREENGARDIFNRQDIAGGYDFLKPSVVFRYNYSDDLRFKAAFSQTIGRPNPDQVSKSGGSINFDDEGDLTKLSRGNPDLKPRQSNNYDLGVEYYFDDDQSIFSMAVFYKDVSDEIASITESEDVLLDGVVYEDVLVSQPRNIDSSSVFGVEAQLIKSRFDFLPGILSNFGFRGNLMWTDAEITLPVGGETVTYNYLPHQSEWVGNAALTYSWQDQFEGRLAYALRGLHRTSVQTNPAGDNAWDDYATWDLSLRWQVNDNLRFEFDGRNLTDESRIRLKGPNLDLLDQDVYSGASYFLGFSYTY